MPLHDKQQFALAERVTQSTPVDGMTVLTYPMGDDIATITGSVYGGEDVAPSDAPLLAAVLAAMLEEGTKQHSKHWIHERLESLGATVSFRSEGERIVFDAQCRARDATEVIHLIFEQLRSPALKQRSLDTVKQRLIAHCQQNHDNTSARARSRFTQLLYNRSHPNYEVTPAQAIRHIRAVDASTLRRFHRDHLGLGDALCCVVGDISHDAVADALEASVRDWQQSPDATTVKQRGTARQQRAHEEVITMKDKTSTDVFMGSYHGLTHTDDDFYPLLVGIQILGGHGFNARLMQEVRDRRGLTYGAYATLRGTKHKTDGFWYAWSTFAPELLHDGLTALRNEIVQLTDEGVSQQEVANKTTQLCGQYTVGLATTTGIAYTLRTNAEEGYAVSEIDRFTEKMHSVTAAHVNAAIARHIDADNMTTVIAGAVDDNKQPLTHSEAAA